MKFITVTLTPYLDRTLVVHYLALGYHNHASDVRQLDPAGRGVNISRALHRMEMPTHALVLLGDDPTGRAYRLLLQEIGFSATFLWDEGHTRTRTIIVDTSNNTETQITDKGLTFVPGQLSMVADALRAHLEADDMVILGGPLPQEAPADCYAHLINVTHEAGAKAVIAADGDALNAALLHKPEVIALTELECEAFFNRPVRVQADVLSVARELRLMGASEVLIQMPSTHSVILLTNDGSWSIPLPDNTQGTSRGVWDALLAGFLTGRAAGKVASEALALGGSAAAYAAEQVGTVFGDMDALQAFAAEIEVSVLNDHPAG